MSLPLSLLICGVSGSGKSTLGEMLASALGLPFYDADDFHSDSNRAKMAAGVPLTDEDRQPWLDQLATLLSTSSPLVLACSALKLNYRQRLRAAYEPLMVIFLQADFDTVLARLNQRQGHFFKGEALLRDQFTQLELPDSEALVAVDIRLSPEQQLKQVLSQVDAQP